MRLIERLRYSLRSWRRGHALVAIPLSLIILITIVDFLAPRHVHLGPLLAVAPALAASFAGPRITGAIAVLAVTAQVLLGMGRGGLMTLNHQVQVIALVVVSSAVVIISWIRDRHHKEFERVRTVSEAAQRILLRPLPRRIGSLEIATMYVAAAPEARIGGDLYAAARTADGTRLIIGDVRGKGLTSVSDAALLLCAFREASHRHAALQRIVKHLENSVCRNLAELAETDENAREHFVTAALLDIPDGERLIRLISCGHPPPLLLHDDQVTPLRCDHAAPPLGLADLSSRGYRMETFLFEPGDTLVLYTDGVIEARDPTGAFYPFTERVRAWSEDDPETLVKHLREDLLAYVGGHLDDDAAVIAIQREADHLPA